MKVIRRTSRLRAVNQSLFYTSSKLIIFITLLSYVVTGNTLTAEKVAISISCNMSVIITMSMGLLLVLKVYPNHSDIGFRDPFIIQQRPLNYDPLFSTWRLTIC